jgi:hypothetical protein
VRSTERRDDRTRLRSRLNENRDKIVRSLNTAPDDVDGREPLWQERYALLNKLES